MIGDLDRIQQTIVGEASPAENHLCTLHFCDHAEWSKLQPKPDEPGQFLSVMTKWYV
jgi:hypothetical protein